MASKLPEKPTIHNYMEVGEVLGDSIMSKKVQIQPWNFETDGISPSGLERFITCREHFRLLYKECYAPRFMSPALLFGTGVHNVLDGLYTEWKKPFTVEPSTRALVIDKLLDEYETIARPQFPKSGKDQQELQKTLGHIASCLNGYFKKWAAAEKKRRYLYRELKLKVKFEDTLLVGTLDSGFIGKEGFKKEGQWIEDTKTGSSFFGKNPDVLLHNLQLNMYAAMMTLETGREPIGIVHNQIKRPQIKVTAQDGSLKNHLLRLDEDLVKRSDEYYSRIPVLFPKGHIKRWIETFLTPAIADLRAWSKGEAPHYYNPLSLLKFSTKSDYYALIVDGDTSGYKRSGLHWQEYRDVD